MAILLYTPLILNNIKNSIFFLFYTLNTSLQRYNNIYIINLYFLAPKCVLNNRLYSSTKYTILSTINNLNAFPSIKRREISLQLFTTIQSLYFSFYSSIIFITFYSYNTFPVLSNLVKKVVISLFNIGYSSYYTLINRPSLFKALSGLALNITILILYLAIGSYSNQLQLAIVSSSYLYSSGTEKNA